MIYIVISIATAEGLYLSGIVGLAVFFVNSCRYLQAPVCLYQGKLPLNQLFHVNKNRPKNSAKNN
jgi:hypothetical protein